VAEKSCPENKKSEEINEESREEESALRGSLHAFAFALVLVAA
jgi:hypothetical protein